MCRHECCLPTSQIFTSSPVDVGGSRTLEHAVVTDSAPSAAEVIIESDEFEGVAAVGAGTTDLPPIINIMSSKVIAPLRRTLLEHVHC